MGRTTRLISAADVRDVVSAVGIDAIFDELIVRLTDALASYDPALTECPNRAGFRYDTPELGLLEWMPILRAPHSIAVKTVGYHPANPSKRGLPSVMATTSLYDQATGQLTALVDATLLTALRTGAASAIATDVLAVDAPIVLGVVGCGAQAITQVHAISRVRRIERVVAFDIDPAVESTFRRRLHFLDRPVETLAAGDAAARIGLLGQVDVLCTCTSVEVGARPVIHDRDHRPWLHVNAIGADFPGKSELPTALLERSVVCPDVAEQCRAEGESQRISGPLGPDLAELVQQRSCHEALRSRPTVFDSTGWALEDLVVAEMVLDHAAALGLGTAVALQATAVDPHDPYGALAV